LINLLRITKEVKIPKRPKVLFFIIIAIVAAYYIPRVYAASYAPQILAMTPIEVNQGQNILEDDEIIERQDIEITIVGTSLSLDTVVYVNNRRVDYVWEITRYDELEYDNDETADDLDDDDESNYSIFDAELDGFESGLRFYLPHALLLESGEISIVAVNNADAIIPARSNSVSLRVSEVEYPEIISITVALLTDLIVELHIYGEDFDPDANVLVNGVAHRVVNIYDEQNIYV